MKKTLFAISAIAVLLGFTACTSENEILEPQVSGKTITIKASTEEATRTELSGNDTEGYKVVWETGDEIKIGENTFTLTDGEETTSGTFESTTATLTDGENYTAYYPADYDGTNWPTTQTYTANNITGSPMKATFTYSTGEDPFLAFKNVGGILRLKLTGTAKVTSIKISATGLDPITLDCGSKGVQLDESTATPFHIAVPGADGDGTAYSGLKIVITDDAGKVCTKTLKSDKSIAVKRSQITTVNLSATTFNPNYLCFTAQEAGAKISMTLKASSWTPPTLEYSTDKIKWKEFVIGTTTVTLNNVNDKVYFRGNNSSGFSSSSSKYVYFNITNKVAASGSVMSLIDPTCQKTTIPNKYCFFKLFYNCSGLTTAPELSAETLATYCYNYMFYGCTSLETAPELSAETLATYCYNSMFYGCTSLETAPELSAETLASYCYAYMFQGCTSLETAPALRAETLATYCYSSMFSGCKKLTSAPALPATTLAQGCYQYMFQNCTSLETAPELSAETLASQCYQYMFYDCTSLNSVTCLATDISASDCVGYWLYNVASSGTFTKAKDVTWPSGASGIPTGWTTEEK